MNPRNIAIVGVLFVVNGTPPDILATDQNPDCSRSPQMQSDPACLDMWDSLRGNELSDLFSKDWNAGRGPGCSREIPEETEETEVKSQIKPDQQTEILEQLLHDSAVPPPPSLSP